MARESVIHEVPVQGPATHVIAIGVGAYDHLEDGSGTTSRYSEGMGQLTSAPVSVCAFVDWVIREFHNPHKPLASVRLVASGLSNDSYRHPLTGDEVRVPKATKEEVRKAIVEWKAEGDKSEENLLIFYYVGHGLAKGALQSLLLSKFGADDDWPLDDAIDFTQLRVGMQRCEARQQLYFIDACRAISDKLLGHGYAGQPIIQPGLNGYRGDRACEAPVYFATLLGEDAYARPKKPTVFTDALLRSFRGAASDDAEGDWRVRTTNLTTALDFFMRRARESGLEILQKPSSTDTSAFFFHYLRKPPEIPVVLRCDPQAAHEHVVFEYPVSGVVQRKSGGPLEVELETGQYQFAYSFPTAPPDAGYRGSTVSRYLYPPYFSPPPLKVTG